MHFLSWLYVIAAVVLLFGATVLVHELGHFWMARRRGMKIGSLSIGFGPEIFGWTRNGVAYAWRLIPAGGYVTLPQMLATEEDDSAKGTATLPRVAPGSKILVAFAGPVMNVMFAVAIAVAVYFLGLPIRVNPAIIGQVPVGSPEAGMGLRAGDRIVAVNGHPVKSWQDVQQTVALARTNVLPVTIARHGAQTTFHLTARFNQQLGLKLLDLFPEEHPTIARVLRASPAAKAGLKPGDEVVGCAGVPVVGADQLIDLLKNRPGEPTPMEVMRGRERVHLTVTPALNPVAKAGMIGVVITPNATVVYQVQAPGPPPWKLVGQACQQIYDSIAALVHWRQTGVGLEDLSGPPGILAILAAEVKTDYRLALKFMVLLNLSLGVLNLLPVPVLDGGHILLALVEQLRGRPASARFQATATNVFATLLISFVLYVSYNDIVNRFSLFRSILTQQAQIESGSRHTNAPPPATQ